MKILLAALDNLGDTVLAVPVYLALRRLTGAEISLWTKDYAAGLAPLMEGSPAVFSCDPFWDRAPGRGKGALGPWLRAVGKIRAAGFDSAVILRANWRKNLSCALAGIPERWADAGAFRTRALPRQAPGEHILDSYRSAVKEITGSDPGELRCSLTRPSAPPPGRRAAVHPFSGNAARNLPGEVWLDIIAGLRARGFEVTVIGSAAEKASFPPGADAAFSCDSAPDLRGLASLISGAALFIGHDSGPLHMAAALGAPSVGIIQDYKIPVIGPRGSGPLELAVFSGSPSELDAARVLAAADRLPRP
ncbi:MAG: hypothetical protein M0025_01990 [Elusimicrobia bacterium]|nr:hypothetical protein [Elusimicrobiota bacterium]